MRRVLAALIAVGLLATAASAGWPPRWRGSFGVGDENDSGRDVYYYYEASTGFVWVRGNISTTKDIVQRYRLYTTDNQRIDFASSYIISPSTANSEAAWTSNSIVSGAAALAGADDDAAPIQTQNAGFLSGIHGLLVPKAYCAGTTKTNADIGTKWMDDQGHRFILTKVSGDSLTFYCKPSSYVSATWTMATAINNLKVWNAPKGSQTDSITFSGQTTEQQYPMEVNHTRSVLRNGYETIAPGRQGYAGFIDLVDEFDIVDPSTIDTTQSGSWSWTSGASALMRVTITYRATPGCTGIHTIYDTKRSFNAARLVGTQVCAIATGTTWANRYYYLPKVRSLSGAYNWTAPQLINSTGSLVNFTADSLLSATDPPYRAVFLLKKNAESNYDIGYAFGYAPFGDAAQNLRGSGASWYPWVISGPRKAYPVLRSYDAGVLTATTGDLDFWCYRQWLDPKAHSDTKWAYWNNANQYGDDMVYVDYHGAQTADATVLPSRMWGKTVTVVDTLHVTGISATVPPTGIVMSTTPAGGDTLAYAVLRLQ